MTGRKRELTDEMEKRNIDVMCIQETLLNTGWEREGNAEGTWQKLKETLRKASEETLGRTKSGRKKQRDSWWWNKDMRKVLKERKLTFKRWQKSMLEIDGVEYRLKRREAKKIIAIIRKHGTQELYNELETK